MIQKIMRRGDPVLGQPCRKVTNLQSVVPIIQDLWDTLENAKKAYPFSRGCGIAAPQIGKALQISVVEYKGKNYTLINPKIIRHSMETFTVEEGCLSFFKYRGLAERYKHVAVEALDEQGKVFVIEADEGDFSSLLQHEIDHLNGVLYTKRLVPGEKLKFLPKKPEFS